MTVRLTVDAETWRRDVDRIVDSCPGLVPVVKGNGYGLGRRYLAGVARNLADTIAVGTVHELHGLPDAVHTVVLTPAIRPPADIGGGNTGPILTVGSLDHVRLLDGWRGRVLVKLASSMHRFGVVADELGDVVRAARSARLDVVGFSLHPPLAGSDDAHAGEVRRWMDVLDEGDELWVSHLSPPVYRALIDEFPDHRFRIRMGTGLWHGGKHAFRLHADVLAVEQVSAGDVAGYQATPILDDGQLVVIGAGSANGIHRLPAGLSPFHFRRRRLPLLESPHMHTSMVVVPASEPGLRVGDWVDVQWPLVTTHVDVIRWTS